jgi:hypothetical protein
MEVNEATGRGTGDISVAIEKVSLYHIGRLRGPEPKWDEHAHVRGTLSQQDIDKFKASFIQISTLFQLESTT